jgi:UDP-N-acetylmuramoyl-tripeptide--D-alanyl-D-alanine ligase
MITLGATAIAKALSAELVGAESLNFDSVFTDTRKPIHGGLFFALVGPNFDGHHYVKAAVEAGASGVVVSTLPDSSVMNLGNVAIFLVEDTRQALTDLARHVRALHPGQFIAVTGSVGKTTVKDMLGAALKESGAVAVSPGNWNNDIGVPLALFATTGTERFVVMELGMSAPGEIRSLCELVDPVTALVTRAAAAHLEFFDSVDAIADAKAEIWEKLDSNASAIACGDDPRLVARLASIDTRTRLTYGVAPEAQFRLTEVSQSAEGLIASVSTPDGPVHLKLSALGEHNGVNAAGALAAAWTLGVDVEEAAASLSSHYEPAPHRLNLKRTTDGLVILDDCYNANPASTTAALATLNAIAPPECYRGAVLGSMLELGPSARQLHEEVGRFAAQQGVQWLGATGPYAESIAEGARDGGIDRVVISDDALDLIGSLEALNDDGNWLLLKGSRGGRLERLLAPLGVEEAA